MGKSHKGGSPEGFLPSARIFTGAQGKLGIVTWANLKAVYLPAMDMLFFIPFDNIENLVEATYRIQRLVLSDECFAGHIVWVGLCGTASEKQLEYEGQSITGDY